MIFAIPFIMHLLRSFSNASLLLHHHFDVFNLEHIFSNSHPLRLSSWIRLFLVLEGGKTRRQISKQALILQTIYVCDELSLSLFCHFKLGEFFIYLFILMYFSFQSLKSFHAFQICQHMAAAIVGIICVNFFGHIQFGSPAPMETL